MLVNNEFGRLKSVLLCLPTYMAYMPVNAITNRNLEKGAVYDSQVGVREMKELAAAMASTGTVVYFEQPQPDLQSQAWTRDRGLCLRQGHCSGGLSMITAPGSWTWRVRICRRVDSLWRDVCRRVF